MCPVSWSIAALLFGAGVLGGLTGSIAGLASVATYPALLLAGLPPVAANVTNTVALVFNGVGSITGSRPELVGQASFLRRTVPAAALGGLAGAVLLLCTPAEGFEKVVPVLLAGAAVAILVPVRPPRDGPDPGHGTLRRVSESGAIVAICVYGGYFGAAAGVLLLALLLQTGTATLARANAAKNVVLAASNTVAAVVFALVAPVHWGAALVLGLGCLAGSRLGPVVVRRAPSTPLRWAIGLAGVALAVKLGVDAYR
jgi:uncharacterized protein